MGISLEMFCKLYKANAKAKDKTFEDFIKKHITTDYVNFLNKEVICTSIINTTCHTNTDDRKITKINSSSRYIFFIMKMIETYTDIEIDIEKHPLDYYYDELNKIGAIDVLVNAIPEKEYAEFSTLLDMKLDDFINNEYSITALLYNLKESFSISEEVINSVIEEIKKQANEE